MLRRLALATSLMMIMLLLAGCGERDTPPSNGATAPEEGQADLAPEFASIENWINTEPLTLESLRGNPVLIVFWSDT